MTSGAVARRYARALYELAAEDGRTAEVGESLAALAQAVAGLEPGTLARGVLSADQRQQLGAALGRPLGADSTLGRFLGVLAEHDRLEQLPGIDECYRRLDDQAAGRVRLRVTSAAPLDDAAVAAIVERFRKRTGREVVAETTVRDELIGGVTVELEGRVYDGSVRTQLARLQSRMAGEA